MSVDRGGTPFHLHLAMIWRIATSHPRIHIFEVTSTAFLPRLIEKDAEYECQTRHCEKNVLVLQGGGALGAYQAGAYEGLSAAGIEPNWVAGISIGAINAAIIAGNRPEHRGLSPAPVLGSRLEPPDTATAGDRRQLAQAFNETSAALVASTGAPGFFTPRYPPAVFNLPGTMDAISIYDTYPLKETLLELIDFDILNSGTVQFSIGAVEVDTGNLKRFDSRRDTITPEHIMASGALPPGFPPVEIDGKLYWDGGIVSNTPLQYLIDGGLPRDDICIFRSIFQRPRH